MPTVINNPPPVHESESSAGLILGVILALVLIALFFIYILPELRGENNTNDTTPGASVNIDLRGNDSNSNNQ